MEKDMEKNMKKDVKSMVIRNGRIHDAKNETAYQADLYLVNGKIEKIVKLEKTSEAEKMGNLEKTENASAFTDKIIEEWMELDASGMDIYPGFVDAHCHIGLDGYAIGFEGDDCNEMTDILTPQLSAIDGINPQDETFELARSGGVTCVATGPGSANVLGGTFCAMKTAGIRVDDMLVKDVIAMKCAFGENPKRCYRDKNNYSRMSTASKLRVMLRKAEEYKEKLDLAKETGDLSKKPAYDEKLEALLPVLEKKIPLKAHAHQANDIFTAIRIAKEFGVDLTIEHCTDGSLIAEELAKEGYPVAVGPSFGHATKFELKNKSFKTPGILSKAGCHVSIITDSPVIPEQYLSLCAGLAIKSGMDEFEALKAITIHPAEHIGVADRVGSIEAGKDADLVLTKKSIFASDFEPEYTLINGVIVYKKAE